MKIKLSVSDWTVMILLLFTPNAASNSGETSRNLDAPPILKPRPYPTQPTNQSKATLEPPKPRPQPLQTGLP